MSKLSKNTTYFVIKSCNHEKQVLKHIQWGRVNLNNVAHLASHIAVAMNSFKLPERDSVSK